MSLMKKKMKVMRMKRLIKKITRTLDHLTIGDRNNSSSRNKIERSVLVGTSGSYGRMTATTSKK